MSMVCNLTIITFERSFSKKFLDNKINPKSFTFSPHNWKYLHISFLYISYNCLLQCEVLVYLPHLILRKLIIWDSTHYTHPKLLLIRPFVSDLSKDRDLSGNVRCSNFPTILSMFFIIKYT